MTPFQKYLKNYPTHANVPLAKFYLGLTLVNQQKYDAARNVLRDYRKQHPKNKNLPDALYRIGECSYLLDQVPVITGVFIEGGIEVDNLQPVCALIYPLLRAGDRIGIVYRTESVPPFRGRAASWVARLQRGLGRLTHVHGPIESIGPLVVAAQ